jgi:adenylate kinase family enzyme
MDVSGLVPAGTRVLVLTGTCGSGKSTVAALIGARPGWVHVSEDDVWAQRFDKSRGAFGTAEHREKRHFVHEIVFESLRAALAADLRVALDVTVHESPPEAYREYLEFFERHRIAWALRVLHPTLDVAIARDSARESGRLGRARVASLHGKFTGQVFPTEWFLDTSPDTPEESVRRLVDPSLRLTADGE